MPKSSWSFSTRRIRDKIFKEVVDKFHGVRAVKIPTLRIEESWGGLVWEERKELGIIFSVDRPREDSLRKISNFIEKGRYMTHEWYNHPFRN